MACVGTVLKMNALNYPDKLVWRDKRKEFTFREWNERSCRFANGLRTWAFSIKTPSP
jgi:hypothetical protein